MINAYITNNNGGTVSVIDTSSNTVVATITVGSQPVGVAVSPDGTKSYICNANNGGPTGTVSVINTSSNTVVATITVGYRPQCIAITPDGTKAYVANLDGTVTPITLATNTAGSAITVGTSTSGPKGIAITPDGTKAYVAMYTPGTVIPITLATNTVGSAITVGTNPNGIAITPDGTMAYVTNYGSGTVTPITLATNTAGTGISAGTNLLGIAITPDGKTAYVANTASSTVTPITLATGTAGSAITVGSNPIALGQFIQQRNPNMSGYVNKFRNAAFNVWQRGTSGTITAGTPAYTADGWIVSSTGANVPWAQTAGRNATRYGLKVTGATSVTDVLFKQRIESFSAAELYPNASAQVTIQAKIYNNTGSSITPTLTVKHAGSADNWSSPTTDVNAVSLQSCPNATLTTVAYTFASASGTPNGLEVTIDCGNNFSANTKSVEVFEWDIRVLPGAPTGLISAPPTPEFLPISLEYAVSQYFLPGINTGGNSVTGIAQGQSTGTTSAFITFFTPVATRVPVTGISISSASHFGVSDSTGASHTCTSVTFASANLNSYSVNLNVASGLASGNATQLQTTSSSANLVFTGAEL